MPDRPHTPPELLASAIIEGCNDLEFRLSGIGLYRQFAEYLLVPPEARRAFAEAGVCEPGEDPVVVVCPNCETAYPFGWAHHCGDGTFHVGPPRSEENAP